MTPEELSSAVTACLQDAIDAGDFSIDVPREVRVERPKNRDHGDWATNIALQLSKQAGMNPRQFAEILKGRLEKIDGVAKVDNTLCTGCGVCAQLCKFDALQAPKEV